MKKFAPDELKAFREGCDEFREMYEEYNRVEYNPFGQRLRPHYCLHGVSNLWADYDSICQYCEDGIFLPVQWGKIRMYQYIERRNREWSALVMDSLMKNAAEFSEFMDKYLDFGMKQVRSLQRTSRAY